MTHYKVMWRIAVYAFCLNADVVLATEPDFKMVCNRDLTVTVTIPYHRSAQIVNLSYGSCNETHTSDITGLTQDPTTHDFTVKMDIVKCSMDTLTNTTGTLMSYAQKAYFEVGVQSDGMRLIFDKFRIDSKCDIETTYEVAFNFGTIEPFKASYSDGAGGVDLEFRIYAFDSQYQNKLSQPPNRAGFPIYLGMILENENFNHCKKSYAITDCIVESEDGQNYTLFDTDDHCLNDNIDFDIRYNDETNIWEFSHLLFLFGYNEITNMNLRCGVVLCDVSTPDSSCKRIAKSCLGRDDFGTQCRVDSVASSEVITVVEAISIPPNSGLEYETAWQGPADAAADLSILTKAKELTLHQARQATKLSNGGRRKRTTLPEEFDLRNHTSCGTLASLIGDQGNCSSSWAFAASTVSQTSACMAGADAVAHSVSHLHQCCVGCVTSADVCTGEGSLAAGLANFAEHGVATETCVPYAYGTSESCASACTSSYTDKSFSEDIRGGGVLGGVMAGVVGFNWDDSTNSVADIDEDQAKYHIMNHGPVAMSLQVFTDFFAYKSGVYASSTSETTGELFVTVIGWGNDTTGGEFWLCANSWGRNWGEQGFFRIKRGNNEADSEQFFHGLKYDCPSDSTVDAMGQCFNAPKSLTLDGSGDVPTGFDWGDDVLWQRALVGDGGACTELQLEIFALQEKVSALEDQLYNDLN